MAFILVKRVDREVFDIIPSHSIVKGKKQPEALVTYRTNEGGVEERVVFHVGTKAQCSEMKNRIGSTEDNDDDDDSFLNKPTRSQRQRKTVKMEVDKSKQISGPKERKINIKREKRSMSRDSALIESQERPQKKRREGYIPSIPPRDNLSTTTPVASASIDTIALEQIQTTLKLMMEAQERQAETLQSIQSTMIVRPEATYNGPAFLSPFAVVQMSALNHSDLAFVRTLLDSVALPGEHKIPVMKRDSIRINFVMEQLRRLRCTGPVEFQSKWKYCVRKYNFNIGRRTKSTTYKFAEGSGEDNEID